MMDIFDLTGATAVVTGGNGGLGLAMARGFGAAGASVALWGRNPDKNHEARRRLEAEDTTVVAVEADVSDAADIERALETTVDALGNVDILVNNAGISVRGPAESLALDDFDAVLNTNLRASLACAQAVYPPMAEAGSGRIINIGSLYSQVGSPFSLPYSVSKGGLVQLTQSLAAGWGSDGIRVNAVIPGWFDTELTKGTRELFPQLEQSVSDHTPLGRWGQPEDLVGTVVFLASAASEFVTGATLVIDGGYSGTM